MQRRRETLRAERAASILPDERLATLDGKLRAMLQAASESPPSPDLLQAITAIFDDEVVVLRVAAGPQVTFH